MGFMSKLLFNANPMGTVKKFINKWKPRKCQTEKDYEMSLFKYLEKELPDIEIIKQYGMGRAKFDIAVGRKVFIEIKSQLNSTSKLQRLIGQLATYIDEKVENLIILICGQADKNLLKQLERKVEEYNGNEALTWFGDDTVVIIQK